MTDRRLPNLRAALGFLQLPPREPETPMKQALKDALGATVCGSTPTGAASGTFYSPVDTRGQMNLAFDLGNGTAVGLVPPTVFSVGADDKHIVVKQHPRLGSFGDSFDRSGRTTSS